MKQLEAWSSPKFAFTLENASWKQMKVVKIHQEARYEGMARERARNGTLKSNKKKVRAPCICENFLGTLQENGRNFPNAARQKMGAVLQLPTRLRSHGLLGAYPSPSPNTYVPRSRRQNRRERHPRRHTGASVREPGPASRGQGTSRRGSRCWYLYTQPVDAESLCCLNRRSVSLHQTSNSSKYFFVAKLRWTTNPTPAAHSSEQPNVGTYLALGPGGDRLLGALDGASDLLHLLVHLLPHLIDEVDQRRRKIHAKRTSS